VTALDTTRGGPLRRRPAQRRLTQHLGAATATVLVVGALSACGSSSSGSTSSDPSATTQNAANTSSNLAAFNAKVNRDVSAALAKQTPAGNGQPTAGPKAVKGKTVLIIPPGTRAATQGGFRVAWAARDAALSLGWKVDFITPTTPGPTAYEAAVQQGISQHVDGIFTVSIDGALIPTVLHQAKAAGIKLIGEVAANTNSSVTSDTGIYAGFAPSYRSLVQTGYLLGEEAYKLTGGHIRAIDMVATGYGIITGRLQGWLKFISACHAAGGDCKVLDTVKFTGSQITTELPQRTASAARSNPTWNVLWPGFDSGLPFMEPGIRTAGSLGSGQMALGFDGNAENLQEIRSGGFERATIGLSTVCLGYAGMDIMNHLFAGEMTDVLGDHGCQNKLLTKADVPASGAWWGDFDPRPLYWKLWGVPAPAHPTPLSQM
jgi:ribose transport system substrate-binding protein